MRREGSSTFSTLLFFLLIFLLISEIQARKLQQVCSSSCGDIKNITYPFRLKDDQPGCGDPIYELSCENNKTILELLSGKYYVKRIFYDENIISVVDVNLASGSCNLPYKSLSRLDLIISNYRSDYYELSARFYNCSRNVSEWVNNTVPCLSRNQSNVYVIPNYGERGPNFPESCSLISVTPAQGNAFYGYEFDPTYEYTRKLLQSGFNLRWSVNCCKCVAVGGSCETEYGFIPFLCRRPDKYLLFMPKKIRFILEETYYAIFAPILESDEYKFNLSDSLMGSFVAHLLFVGLAVAVLISRIIFTPLVLFVYIIHKYRTTWKKVDKVEKFLQNQQSWMPKRYSYSELIAMTNHFQDKLGQGGFGSVYKGQLHSGCSIAVKVLENSKFSAEEFINEVSTIGRIHHVNVVQLVGFCSDGSKRALVYEYMSNGSLDRHIFSKECRILSFGWEKLVEIALGTARGIEYLHKGCDMCILHFDIKPHNILLDHNLIPKISDFGLAKFYSKENNFVSISAARGTIGYIAPELISRNFGAVSCKSDVYSFGMLLLEMAGGRRNSDMRAARSSKAYFPSWVYDRINKGEDLELPNATETEAIIARKLCTIGLWCIQVKATDRPSTTRVIEMLEGRIDHLQMPPKPFFCSSQDISTKEIQTDYSTELLITSESMEECLYNGSDL